MALVISMLIVGCLEISETERPSGSNSMLRKNLCHHNRPVAGSHGVCRAAIEIAHMIVNATKKVYSLIHAEMPGTSQKKCIHVCQVLIACALALRMFDLRGRVLKLLNSMTGE